MGEDSGNPNGKNIGPLPTLGRGFPSLQPRARSKQKENRKRVEE